MRINQRFKPDKAVAKNDEPNSTLNKVFVSKDKIIASDGKIVVFIPIEVNKNDSVNNLLDPYIFEELRSFANKDLDFVEMDLIGNELEGKAILKNGIELSFQLVKADQDLIPPKYEDVIPKNKEKISFGINISLLKKLCDSIGTSSIIITYFDPLSVLKITPLDPISKEVGYIATIKAE